MVKLRTATNPYRNVGTRTNYATPQTQAIPGREADMQLNNAGGYSFVLDSWKVLDRFLVLGTEGGTYYVNEQKLTKDNTKTIQQLIAEDGIRVVNRVVELSESGRAAKADPGLFVLALAISQGDTATKRRVIEVLPRVARIGTHLFTFAQYATQFRGWGRILRDAISNWYTSKDAEKLAYQAVKYQQRNGWSNRDLLRLSHATTTNPELNEIFHWIVKGWDYGYINEERHHYMRQIIAFEQAKKATNAKEIIKLITEYDLPREAIPTEFLKDKGVWAALLQKMPMTAMIRNLATMSRVGLLKPFSDAAEHIARELVNEERIRKARVHPIQVLSALRVYNQGSGYRSRGADFEPVDQIIAALDKAFYLSFGNVEPTGKRIILGLDVSGSMGSGDVLGLPGLTPREATAAMAMVTARSEWDKNGNIPRYHSLAFTTQLTPFPLSPNESIKAVMGRMEYMPFGGTDCSLPIKYALDTKLEVDAFMVWTDNETWAGRNGHPSELLQRYRKESGIPARLAVIGLTATDISIADPKDAGMLDICGFDSAAPQILSDFVRGNI
jgi:60 kDa SS-A/Ro ribonucleoprotein